MNNINKVLEEFESKFPFLADEPDCSAKDAKPEVKQFITKAIQDRDTEVIEMVEKIKYPLFETRDGGKFISSRCGDTDIDNKLDNLLKELKKDK